jgi:hypothetical protein
MIVLMNCNYWMLVQRRYCEMSYHGTGGSEESSFPAP